MRVLYSRHTCFTQQQKVFAWVTAGLGNLKSLKVKLLTSREAKYSSQQH